jgi:uncharacterized protein (TIGR02147 family)
MKAGIKSPTLFKEVVEGKRNLTSHTIQAFIKGIGLTEHDARYFSALVHFNQSKSNREKTEYLEQMRGIKRVVTREVVPIDQYEYYSRWYHAVLRELVCIMDWNDDYGLLAKSVVPQIKKSEAKESVKFLLEKGFIRLENNTHYVQTNPAITTGSEVSSMGVRSFNESMAKMGVDSINNFSPSVRDIRCVVVGVSEKSYSSIKDEIREFMSRITRIVDDDQESDRVYNVGIQFFPLSESKNSEGAVDADA